MSLNTDNKCMLIELITTIHQTCMWGYIQFSYLIFLNCQIQHNIIYKIAHYNKKAYFKDKFNKSHGPCEMTNYTNKHYTVA